MLPSVLRYLRAEAVALTAHETDLVLTADAIVGAPRPGVILVDRWGEIHHVAEGCAAARRLGLPSAAALIEWMRYLRNLCPECEGESR